MISLSQWKEKEEKVREIEHYKTLCVTGLVLYVCAAADRFARLLA